MFWVGFLVLNFAGNSEVYCEDVVVKPIYPSPEQLKEDKLKNKKKLEILDPANNRWRAMRIGIVGNKQAATIKKYYKKPWDFSDGIPQIMKGQKNVSNLKVEEGILKYTSDGNGEIFWGNHYVGNPEYGELTIGDEWWSHWMPIYLKLRIKQSLVSSDWTVSMRPVGSRYAYRNVKKFTLKGKEWQEVELNLADSRVGYATLSLECLQAGNNIEIDSVSIYTPSLTRVYQKELMINSEIEKAAFCINTAPEFRVEINGKEVCSQDGNHQMASVLYSYDDMGKYFQKGKNTIRVYAEEYNWQGMYESIVMEGVVYGKDGSLTPIETDAGWLGQYLLADNKVDNNNWKPVKVLGRNSGRFGYSESGAYYLNPPYYGRIIAKPANRKLPIFRPGEKIEFALELFDKGLDDSVRLEWEVKDSFNKDATVLAVNNISHEKGKSCKAIFAPQKPGVYDLVFQLTDSASGKVIDRHVCEAVSVGRIEQKEISGTSANEGLKLKELETIDCTALDRPFVSYTRDGKELPAQIITRPWGKYLQGGVGKCSFLSWKLEFPNYQKPVLLEIEYPDDAERIMGLSVGTNSYFGRISNDHGDREWPCGVGGIYTGYQNEITNKMRTTRMVFFPSARVCSITVMNADAINPVAISKIKVFEIENDLPAVKFYKKPERLTGVHAERITEIPNSFYNGEMNSVFSGGHLMAVREFDHFYREWYLTNSNLIKYMRFCGENMLIAGMHMYIVANYPTRNPDDLKVNSAQADVAALLGEMFAANDLNLILGVEFANPAPLRSLSRKTDEQVAAGAKTYLEVDRHGKQIVSWHKIANVNDNEVQSRFYEVIADLCQLYKNNPGVKGVLLQQGRSSFHPVFPQTPNLTGPLDSGYSDTTIEVFENETGIKIPVDYKDPQRFSKRYDWLMKNKKAEWIKWRARKMFNLNKKAADMIKAANPNWLMYIIYNTRLNWLFDSKLTFTEYLVRSGFDPALYNDPAFCIGREYPETVRDQANEYGKYSAMQIFNASPEIIKLYTDRKPQTCVQTGPQFFEPHLRIPKDKWYWDSQLNGSYAMPTDENVLRLYNRILARQTPEMIAQYWTDMNLPNGSEQPRRDFNRAFLAIPEGNYETLKGNGFDDNTVVRKSGSAFYIVNLLGEELTLQLSFNAAKDIVDLVSGDKLQVKNGSVGLLIAPYGMRVFGMENGSLQKATSSSSKEFVEGMKNSISKLLSVNAQAKTTLVSVDKKSDNYSALEEYIETSDQIISAYRAKAYGRAFSMYRGYKMKRLMALTKDMVAPISWKLIGPFANSNRENFDKVLDVESDLLNGVMKKSYSGVDGKTVTWQKIQTQSNGDYRGIINLCEIYGNDSMFLIAYAVTSVYVKDATQACMLLGSDDGLKVWINGKQVFRIKPARGLTPGEDSVVTDLKAGWNTVILKLENNIGAWGASFELKQLDGTEIPGLRYSFNN